MFKKIFHVALAALTVFGAIGPLPLLSGVASAASPNTLSYQGRLKDADGVVVADGDYDFTFTLWTALDAGVSDWTEDQTLTVTDGYFHAQLGSVDPFLDGLGQEADFTVPLFLEVEVEAETLDPRVAVNSVAYSFSSRSIESFANEAAAEADAANFGGRMYYNTTTGNLFVFDSIANDWVDTTGAAGAADDLDDAYNNFGASAAAISVDNAEGQGDLTFTLDGADIAIVDSTAATFVTFSDAGTTTIAGLLNVSGVSTFTANVNANAGFDVDDSFVVADGGGVTVGSTFAANGTVTIGDGGDTVAVNSSDWDITATGDMSGIGTIDANGAVTFTSTLAVTGNTTLTGDLAVNGDDITSDGDLTIDPAGGQVVFADTDVFNIGGITGAAYNAISNGAVADSVNVAADNDLYIQDDLEVDGTSVFDGNTDLNGTVSINAVTTFNASPVFNSTLTASGAIEANGGITTQDGTALTLNSGDVDAINIGTDADAESINIGTGAATKTITIGNGTLATVLNVDTGTGGFDVDLLGAMSVDGELVVIGGAADGNTATGDGDLYVVSDLEIDGIVDVDGSFDFDGTTFDADGSGLVSLTSTGASLTLATTDAGDTSNVVLSAGNAAPDAGENGNDVALEAEDDVLIETTDDFDVDAADMVVLTSGTITLDTAGVLELNSSAGAISIGDDAVAQAINVGTGAAARTITVGNAASTEVEINGLLVDINGGATGVTIDGGAASNFTTSAGILTLDGNGGVNIVGNAAEIDLTTSGAVDINSGAGTWDASTLSIDSTDTTNLTMTANDAGEKTLSIAATNVGAGAGRIGINSDGAVSIDAVTASNFTVTGAADLTLMSTAGSVITSSGQAAADAIRIFASDAAGGIDVDFGTGDMTVTGTGASADFTLDADLISIDGTGTSNFSVAGGAGEDFTVAQTGAADASLFLSSTGTGADALTLNASAGGLTIDSSAALEINSSAGAISIGNDAVAQAINVGTAGARDITIGNTVGATSLNVDSGTGGINFGDSAVNKIIDIGGVTNNGGDTVSIATEGTTADTLAIGNANAATTLALTGGDDWSLSATGVLTMSASAPQATAFVVTDTDYTNALSVDDNNIIGTTAAIDFTNFDVATTGNVTLATGMGLDSTGALVIGAGATTSTSICNTATCDTLTLGNNADADTITIGDAANDTTTLNGATVAIDSGDWDITSAGVVTGLNQLSLAFPAPVDNTNGITVTNTASANSYDLVDVTVTAPNADAAPDTARGLSVTMGATNEATDAVKGITVTGSASANGSNFGIELNSGGGATVNDWGIVLGANWDKDIFLTDTSAIFAFADGGNLTFEDGNGNDAFVLADTSTANNHVLTGDADTGLSLSGMTTDLSTPVAEDLTITPGGVGDLIVSTDADTTLTLSGGGDGVDSLVMTDGDLKVTDGQLIVGFGGAGGDFDVTLDSGDSASISNGGNSNSTGALAVTNVYTNNADSDGFTVSQTLQDYVDDNVVDTRTGIKVTVTNNATDAGGPPNEADTIYGLNVANLTGAQANGSEYAIKVGTGWDAEIALSNNELIINSGDDVIQFVGDGGTNNTTLSVDLDGAAATVPTLTGGVSDVIAINDSLFVGVDGTTADNINLFSASGGDDLYVEDDFGVDGDAVFDQTVSVGNETQLTANSTTPSVSGGTQFFLNNTTNPTLISNFTNGVAGQLIFVRVAEVGAASQLDCTGASLNCGTTDIVLATNDSMLFYKTDPGNWQLVAMMDSSDNHNAGNGFDLAEWFPSEESLAAGDVVSVDSTRAEYVRKSQGAYEPSVIGIVSTNPGYTLGEPAVGYAAQIALAGRVPVNVTNENGTIVPGDYLTTSSTPGYAMKATEAGPVIGIAMDSFGDASGQVVAKIANFWYTPPTSGASSLQGSDGSALAAGALDADALVVAGDAVFQGSVTVEEHVNVGQDVAGRARIIAGDTLVHVPFERAYSSQPIVTATLRTATNIPGYWWVEQERTDGFYIALDGTLPYDVEFNWIALGVTGGRVSVSDGSVRDIEVYVAEGGAPAEPVVAEPAASEPPASEPAAEDVVPVEPEPTVVDPIVEETVVEPEPAVEPEPVVEESAPAEEPTAEPVVEPAPEPTDVVVQ